MKNYFTYVSLKYMPELIFIDTEYQLFFNLKYKIFNSMKSMSKCDFYILKYRPIKEIHKIQELESINQYCKKMKFLDDFHLHIFCGILLKQNYSSNSFKGFKSTRMIFKFYGTIGYFLSNDWLTFEMSLYFLKYLHSVFYHFRFQIVTFLKIYNLQIMDYYFDLKNIRKKTYKYNFFKHKKRKDETTFTKLLYHFHHLMLIKPKKGQKMDELYIQCPFKPLIIDRSSFNSNFLSNNNEPRIFRKFGSGIKYNAISIYKYQILLKILYNSKQYGFQFQKNNQNNIFRFVSLNTLFLIFNEISTLKKYLKKDLNTDIFIIILNNNYNISTLEIQNIIFNFLLCKITHQSLKYFFNSCINLKRMKNIQFNLLIKKISFFISFHLNLHFYLLFSKITSFYLVLSKNTIRCNIKKIFLFTQKIALNTIFTIKRTTTNFITNVNEEKYNIILKKSRLNAFKRYKSINIISESYYNTLKNSLKAVKYHKENNFFICYKDPISKQTTKYDLRLDINFIISSKKIHQISFNQFIPQKVLNLFLKKDRTFENTKRKLNFLRNIVKSKLRKSRYKSMMCIDSYKKYLNIPHKKRHVIFKKEPLLAKFGEKIVTGVLSDLNVYSGNQSNYKQNKSVFSDIELKIDWPQKIENENLILCSFKMHSIKFSVFMLSIKFWKKNLKDPDFLYFQMCKKQDKNISNNKLFGSFKKSAFLPKNITVNKEYKIKRQKLIKENENISENNIKESNYKKIEKVKKIKGNNINNKHEIFHFENSKQIKKTIKMDSIHKNTKIRKFTVNNNFNFSENHLSIRELCEQKFKIISHFKHDNSFLVHSLHNLFQFRKKDIHKKLKYHLHRSKSYLNKYSEIYLNSYKNDNYFANNVFCLKENHKYFQLSDFDVKPSHMKKRCNSKFNDIIILNYNKRVSDLLKKVLYKKDDYKSNIMNIETTKIFNLKGNNHISEVYNSLRKKHNFGKGFKSCFQESSCKKRKICDNIESMKYKLMPIFKELKAKKYKEIDHIYNIWSEGDSFTKKKNDFFFVSDYTEKGVKNEIIMNKNGFFKNTNVIKKQIPVNYLNKIKNKYVFFDVKNKIKKMHNGNRVNKDVLFDRTNKIEKTHNGNENGVIKDVLLYKTDKIEKIHNGNENGVNKDVLFDKTNKIKKVHNENENGVNKDVLSDKTDKIEKVHNENEIRVIKDVLSDFKDNIEKTHNGNEIRVIKDVLFDKTNKIKKVHNENENGVDKDVLLYRTDKIEKMDNENEIRVIKDVLLYRTDKIEKMDNVNEIGVNKDVLFDKTNKMKKVHNENEITIFNKKNGFFDKTDKIEKMHNGDSIEKNYIDHNYCEFLLNSLPYKKKFQLDFSGNSQNDLWRKTHLKSETKIKVRKKDLIYMNNNKFLCSIKDDNNTSANDNYNNFFFSSKKEEGIKNKYESIKNEILNRENCKNKTQNVKNSNSFILNQNKNKSLAFKKGDNNSSYNEFIGLPQGNCIIQNSKFTSSENYYIKKDKQPMDYNSSNFYNSELQETVRSLVRLKKDLKYFFNESSYLENKKDLNQLKEVLDEIRAKNSKKNEKCTVSEQEISTNTDKVINVKKKIILQSSDKLLTFKKQRNCLKNHKIIAPTKQVNSHNKDLIFKEDQKASLTSPKKQRKNSSKSLCTLQKIEKVNAKECKKNKIIKKNTEYLQKSVKNNQPFYKSEETSGNDLLKDKSNLLFKDRVIPISSYLFNQSECQFRNIESKCQIKLIKPEINNHIEEMKSENQRKLNEFSSVSLIDEENSILKSKISDKAQKNEKLFPKKSEKDFIVKPLSSCNQQEIGNNIKLNNKINSYQYSQNNKDNFIQKTGNICTNQSKCLSIHKNKSLSELSVFYKQLESIISNELSKTTNQKSICTSNKYENSNINSKNKQNVLIKMNQRINRDLNIESNIILKNSEIKESLKTTENETIKIGFDDDQNFKRKLNAFDKISKYLTLNIQDFSTKLNDVIFHRKNSEMRCKQDFLTNKFSRTVFLNHNPYLGPSHFCKQNVFQAAKNCFPRLLNEKRRSCVHIFYNQGYSGKNNNWFEGISHFKNENRPGKNIFTKNKEDEYAIKTSKIEKEKDKSINVEEINETIEKDKNNCLKNKHLTTNQKYTDKIYSSKNINQKIQSLQAENLKTSQTNQGTKKNTREKINKKVKNICKKPTNKKNIQKNVDCSKTFQNSKVVKMSIKGHKFDSDKSSIQSISFNEKNKTNLRKKQNTMSKKETISSSLENSNDDEIIGSRNSFKTPQRRKNNKKSCAEKINENNFERIEENSNFEAEKPYNKKRKYENKEDSKKEKIKKNQEIQSGEENERNSETEFLHQSDLKCINSKIITDLEGEKLSKDRKNSEIDLLHSGSDSCQENNKEAKNKDKQIDFDQVENLLILNSEHKKTKSKIKNEKSDQIESFEQKNYKNINDQKILTKNDITVINAKDLHSFQKKDYSNDKITPQSQFNQHLKAKKSNEFQYMIKSNKKLQENEYLENLISSKNIDTQGSYNYKSLESDFKNLDKIKGKSNKNNQDSQKNVLKPNQKIVRKSKQTQANASKIYNDCIDPEISNIITQYYKENLQKCELPINPKNKYQQLYFELNAIYSYVANNKAYILKEEQHATMEKILSELDKISTETANLYIEKESAGNIKDEAAKFERIRRKAISLGLKSLMQFNPKCPFKSQKIIIFETIKFILALEIENDHLRYLIEKKRKENNK